MGRPPDERLVCIHYYCKTCGKGYKKPDSLDLELYRKAEIDFIEIEKALPIPNEKIRVSAKDIRPVNYGFKSFYELFNKRQLLCLGLLLKEILSIRDQNTKEFFLLAFSASLETNNRLAKYESKWGKVMPLFTVPGFSVTGRYAENNVWGSRYGRGSFLKRYSKLKKAKLQFRSEIVRLFGEDALSAQRQAVALRCSSSEKMPLVKSKSVDLVLTDPPYFDNIDYSRLADFFYVWLRIGLKEKYSWFQPHHSSRKKEVTAVRSEEGIRSFTNQLCGVFKESYRVLKDDGVLVFTFHHTFWAAWLALKKALEEAGFKVVATHIVRSEGVTGFRKKGRINHDACIVCRKAMTPQTKKSSVDAQIVAKEIAEHVAEKVAKLLRLNGGLTDADLKLFIYTEAMMYNYQTVSSLDILNIANLIKKIQK